ncbi:response regulator [Paenibacillus thermotolerans]|uniref:response regulator n=1 Tax=Paenibacillus thermotolerans TaxID=3027807 RepID=UPI002367CBF1|nr:MULTISPECIES: response regulator [unclassified Paenibacillus]
MKRVMIVDDSAFMRMYLKNMFGELGHEAVAEASNGFDAIELCRKCQPDLITLDINMPDMDGIAAVKEIRKFDQTVHIIMVSSMGQQSFIREALSYGANDFLVKPFGKERLIEINDKYMAS